MRRREFITLLGGAAATSSSVWSLAARAQQPAVPVIGYLHPGSPEAEANLVAAFRKGLSEIGYVDGRNVAIEFRWGNNRDYERLPELAADLVRRRVAVLATPGSIVAALAAKAATNTIPIVYSSGSDPVQAGLVASFNRPGGNVTGINYMNAELVPKRLGLMHDLVPGATRFAMLVNPNTPNVEALIGEMRAAASVIGGQIEPLYASTIRDIDAAFTTIVQKRTDALLVNPGSPFADRRVQLATSAAHYRLPAIFTDRQYAAAGGLMSYGSDALDQFRQAGIYTGRVLKGEKPADLPILQATKFEFVINLHTANLLGLTVPPGLLAIADEVIE